MNLCMKRLGANVTLPTMVILWGVVSACQGTGFTFFPVSLFLALTARCRFSAFLPESPRLSFPPRRHRRCDLLAPVNTYPILLLTS